MQIDGVFAMFERRSMAPLAVTAIPRARAEGEGVRRVSAILAVVIRVANGRCQACKEAGRIGAGGMSRLFWGS
jgi:hypothetical protein